MQPDVSELASHARMSPADGLPTAAGMLPPDAGALAARAGTLRFLTLVNWVLQPAWWAPAAWPRQTSGSWRAAWAVPVACGDLTLAMSPA